MSKKDFDYRCSVCGADIRSKKELIRHFRIDHPDNPFGLYDILGTIGDPFADAALKQVYGLKEEIRGYELIIAKQATQSKLLLQDIDNLNNAINSLKWKYTQMTRALISIENITNITKDIYNSNIETKISNGSNETE